MATPPSPLAVLLAMLMLSTIARAGGAHECERACLKGDSRTCHYTFALQDYLILGRACHDCPNTLSDCLREECVAADGVARPIFAINRQLPGPSLQVCEGDRIVVDLHNQLTSDAETIHWHGVHMRGEQYYDGVPFLTQCPVLGGTFRYDFLASNPGTHFWHSHVGLHRETIFGTLVIRQAEDPHRGLYDVDVPEHVLAIHDSAHISIDSTFIHRHYGTGDDFARTILINGRGRNSAAKHENVEQLSLPLEIVRVSSGLKHRLRFVGATGFNCPVIISVDGHRFTIIATDGHPIIPYMADSFVLYSGERFDVVLEANQPADNYWIRFNGLIDCSPMECVQGAVLRYEGAPEEDPVAPLLYDPTYPGVVVNPLNNDGSGSSEEVTVVELISLTPNTVPETVDKQFYLAFDFKQVNNTLFYNPDLYPYSTAKEAYKINTPQVNGLTFVLPDSPPLSQPQDVPASLCHYGEDPPCVSDFCSCTYVLEVGLGETVEFVLVDEGNIGDENHPFHLHGYNFYVVAMGRLGSNTSVAEVMALDEAGGIQRKQSDATKKDTVTVPDGGYTIVRFTADNPGWWFMHCHLVFHADVGMAAILHVGEPKDLPPVPEGFPTCGSFVPAI